ncbi:FtsX-like permease family protein [Idiomarina xiamenensis]|uniref:ABC3 transporter permease C-terminal domain-containing protein n=1 Tax=Idiomarina xiamenensis 10-D-4 TaxID=740709 RepID=K2K6A9_9GAMM|nr:FtsX-like permease family protein [Idiomarina xiamenensis]EKE82122.1 hypothetical protein A10D4_10104 [Idiomarina xiamenensis 10-D-4]
MLSDIRYGWRQWRQYAAQMALLVIGFSVFTGLMMLCVATAPDLFKKTPTWVTANDTEYVTIGLRSHEGHMSQTTLANLSTVNAHPAVKDSSFLGTVVASFRINDQSFNGENVVFMQDQLPSLLGITAIARDPIQFQQSAYVSEAFLANWQGPELIGQTVLLGESETPVKVVDTIPQSLVSQPGLQEPVLLVSGSHFSTLLTVDFGDAPLPDAVKARARHMIMQETPNLYGVVTLRAGFSSADLADLSKGRASKEEGISVRSGTDSMDFYLHQGIDFTPHATNALKRQWWIMLVMCVVFAVLNVLNLLTLSINQCIQRRAEFATRVAVGATPATIQKQLLLEQLPLVLTCLGLALILTLASLAGLVAYWGVHIDVMTLVLGAVLSALVLLAAVSLSVLLPFSLLARRQLFQRSRSQEAGPMQRRLGHLNVVAQIAFASLALLFAFAMLTQQWQLRQQQAAAPAAHEFSWSRSDNVNNGIDIKAFLNAVDGLPYAVAVSSKPFANPDTIASSVNAETPNYDDGQGINLISVSSQYFDFFNIGGGSAASAANREGVVLNHAALSALNLRNSAAVFEQRLFIREGDELGYDDEQPIAIAAVVENLPHFGFLNREVAMIYGDLARLHSINQTLYLYVDVIHAAALRQWLQDRQQRQGQLWQFDDNGLLIEQMEQMNQDLNRLVMVSVLVAVLICSLSITSLFYQLSGLLQMRQRRMGVLLAVGARSYQLFGQLLTLLLALTVLAMAVVFITVTMMNPRLSLMMGADMLAPAAISLMLAILVLLLLVSAAVAFMRIMRRPIRQLLQ